MLPAVLNRSPVLQLLAEGALSGVKRDVYKRQKERLVRRLKFRSMCFHWGRWGHRGRGCKYWRSRCPRSVSYTHLDVYKRQDLRPLHIADGGRARPPAQFVKMRVLVTRKNELWTRRCPCHAASIPGIKSLWLCFGDILGSFSTCSVGACLLYTSRCV